MINVKLVGPIVGGTILVEFLDDDDDDVDVMEIVKLFQNNPERLALLEKAGARGITLRASKVDDDRYIEWASYAEWRVENWDGMSQLERVAAAYKQCELWALAHGNGYEQSDN